MGGGEDSRIPSILSETLEGVTVIVRTWSFDPEVAVTQVSSWIEELRPELLVAESLGANIALKVWKGPLLMVSPALGAPRRFAQLSPLSRIYLFRKYFEHRYKPRPGRRQPLDFRFTTLKNWRSFIEPATHPTGTMWAFFGKNDHYFKSGVVDIPLYEKHYGKTYTIYDGTHFMENEFVTTLLKDKIYEYLENGNLQA